MKKILIILLFATKISNGQNLLPDSALIFNIGNGLGNGNYIKVTYPDMTFSFSDSTGEVAAYKDSKWLIIDTIAALNVAKKILLIHMYERDYKTEIEFQEFIMLMCIDEHGRMNNRKKFLSARFKRNEALIKYRKWQETAYK